MLSLIPYDEKHLFALTPLLPEGAAPETLHRDLSDLARGYGKQVAVASAGELPCGVAGWVTFGVKTEGIVYGTPLLAGTEEAASLLLGHLIQIARSLGACQLRVSRFPGEVSKAKALLDLGFTPRLDMISLERPSFGLPEALMPEYLKRVPLPDVDWERFAHVFNKAFVDVPNTPPVDAGMAQEEWEAMDPEASLIWRDSTGRYLAWIGAHKDGYVDVIGVDESLRGQGVALAMYRITASSLAAKGVKRLYTLLASTNRATLRLHEKLGFTEFTRRQVFALDLQS